MKTKSVVIIVSVCLNLVAFSALAYFNEINSRVENTPAPFYRLQHLSEMDHLQGDSHGIALASTAK